MKAKKVYTSTELALRPEDCKITAKGTRELTKAVDRLCDELECTQAVLAFFDEEE